MKAILLTEPGCWSLTEVPDPTPAPDEVVVEVAACGICGTDLHTLNGTNPLVRYPVIPGHEFAGTVLAVGPAVTKHKVGDRVAVDPSRSCGACWNCRSGWPNLCPDKGGHGSRVPGGFAQYVAAREESCVSLSTDLPWSAAALAEPLACVLHGIDRIGPALGKSALVYGAGAIGVLAAGLLTRAGGQVHVVDPVGGPRHDAARAWGVTDVSAGLNQDDAPDPLWDIVVDATGVPSAMEDGFRRLRRAGTMLLLGVASPDARIELSPYAVNWQELTIVGSMAVRHSFQRAVELLTTMAAPVESIVTHTLPLERFADALQLVKSRDAVKVQIAPSAP